MKITDHDQLELSQKPGVYFFIGENNEILYVGKATSLRSRTRSYFNSKLMETRGPLIVKMVEDAVTIETKETDSVLEALLLESNLIKKHQPPYNSREKDNKSHNYVVVTEEILPRVFVVRGRQLAIIQGRGEKLKHIFGPFPQGHLLRTALSILRKIFPFYGKKGKGSYSHEFYKQLGLEPNGHSTEEKSYYDQNIHYLTLFFQGKKATIIKNIKKRMMEYAGNLEFEKAHILKQQLDALLHIRDIALMKKDFDLGTDVKYTRIEAYDIAHHAGEAMVGVMVVHNGQEISSSDHRLFNIQSTKVANDTKALSEVLTRRLQHQNWPYPSLIVADGGIAQKRALEKVLRDHELSIPVVSVVKNEKHKPKGLLGRKDLIEKYKDTILALNAESHRFAIQAHKKKRSKDFLNKK